MYLLEGPLHGSLYNTLSVIEAKHIEKQILETPFPAKMSLSSLLKTII